MLHEQRFGHALGAVCAQTIWHGELNSLLQSAAQWRHGEFPPTKKFFAGLQEQCLLLRDWLTNFYATEGAVGQLCKFVTLVHSRANANDGLGPVKHRAHGT